MRLQRSPRPTWRVVRLFRLARLGLHLLWGAATIAVAFPWVSVVQRRWLKQRWSRQLLEILAVRIDTAGLDRVEPGSLIVANHVSWLDIYALNATRPMAFVAKAEVRGWPLVGWLSAHTETLFLARGQRRDAGRMNAQVAERLRAGDDVGIFPEGTTTDGSRVLPFHAALLQSAIDAGRPVQPVALAYYDPDGRPSTAPAYAGETTLGESLAAVLACRSLTVCLRPTAPLESVGQNRRELARTTQGAVAYALGLACAGGERPEAEPLAVADDGGDAEALAAG